MNLATIKDPRTRLANRMESKLRRANEAAASAQERLAHSIKLAAEGNDYSATQIPRRQAEMLRLTEEARLLSEELDVVVDMVLLPKPV